MPIAIVTDVSAPLSAQQKLRLALEVLATYCRVRWWMRRGDLRGTVSRLRREGRGEQLGDPSPDGPRPGDLRLARAVTRTLSVLPTDSRCLVRSLVLTGLLARRGVASTLVIGVGTQPKFAAHAWVEHAGEPLLPPGDDGAFEKLLEI